MGLMKDLSDKAAANIRSGKAETPRKGAAGIIRTSDIDDAFGKISAELTGQQLRRVISKMNTVIRSQTVKNLRRASSATTVGESMKSKRTRGDWKNPRTVVRPGAAIGTEYLPGGWYGKVLKDRGANKPSMAKNGGEVGRAGGGDTGVISRVNKVKGGFTGITGPRHSGSAGDDGDNGRHGYNYAHMLEFGGNHTNWGGAKSQLEARPFLAPAASETMQKQINILKQEMIKWGKK